MRKKELKKALIVAEKRIVELETILCPAEQHQWVKSYEDECYICKRCGKVRYLDTWEV